MKILLFFLLFLSYQKTYSQTTASSYFRNVSDFYKNIKDFIVYTRITIYDDNPYNEDGALDKSSKTKSISMGGTLYYKSPNLIRLDYSNGQVLLSDGKVFKVYIPKYNVTLLQGLKKNNAANLLTGLDLFTDNYSVAYKNSPNYERLSKNSGSMVKKLHFVWRSKNEGFRDIELDISKNSTIRRIIAKTSDYKTILIDFTNYRLNVGIQYDKFEYDSPPSSNNFNNFLYGN